MRSPYPFSRRSVLPILTAVALLLAGAARVWAHPPSELKLEYDAEKKYLTVTISHIATDPRKHHIRKLVIYKNDHEVETIYLSKQSSSSEHVQSMVFDADAGDRIRVQAVCSEAGSKEETVIVP